MNYDGLRRADWIRTSDPVVPNDVRYRAALLPEMIFRMIKLSGNQHMNKFI